jgi:hypothetical protein
VGDRALVPRWATRLDARNFPIPDSLRFLDAALAIYWSVVQPFLR